MKCLGLPVLTLREQAAYFPQTTGAKVQCLIIRNIKKGSPNRLTYGIRTVKSPTVEPLEKNLLRQLEGGESINFVFVVVFLFFSFFRCGYLSNRSGERW